MVLLLLATTARLAETVRSAELLGTGDPAKNQRCARPCTPARALALRVALRLSVWCQKAQGGLRWDPPNSDIT